MTGKKLKDPGTIPDLPDLIGQQADFFEDYFKKGAEFTRALIAENEALRRRLEAAERPGDGHTFTQSAIEREHYDLACLFVAQGQLARAAEASEVVNVIAEILLNFVGSDRFVVYATDGSDRLRPLFASGADLADLPDEAHEDVVRAYQTPGDPSHAETAVETRLLKGPPLTAFRLSAGDKPLGAIGVWSYLRQKSALQPIDDRLFAVLGDVGGAALEAARVRGQSPRIAGPADFFNGLALLLGIGGRGG